MSILLGALLGVAIGVFIVLAPAIALQLALRFFGTPSARRHPAPHLALHTGVIAGSASADGRRLRPTHGNRAVRSAFTFD